MPNRDGTGPVGNGPKTGRGLGNCETSETTLENKKFGRRSRLGRGLGKQNRNRNRGK